MTTTVTTVDAASTNAKNRVMSIRKKFETLEHLDISVPDIKPRPPKYLFQRSATTFNLSALRRNGNNKENGCQSSSSSTKSLLFSSSSLSASPQSTKTTATSPVRSLSNGNGKCSPAESALALLRKSMRNGGDNKLASTKPSSPTSSSSSSPVINQTPPRLIRQSSDPRRASIKRSPAFRFNEPGAAANQKIALAKSSSLNDCELTDTLKKALRQPLPPGPPPKKPPRLLASPTANEKSFPVKEQRGATTPSSSSSSGHNNASNRYLSSSPATASPTPPVNGGCWSKKLTNGIKSNVNQIVATRPSALLCCNNAHIYDDVASSCYQETQRLIPATTARNGGGEVKKKNEPIYMEPFQHLTMKLNGNENGHQGGGEGSIKPEVQQRRLSVDSLLGGQHQQRNKQMIGQTGRAPGSLSMASGRRVRDGMIMMEVGEDLEEDSMTFGAAAEDARSVTGSIQTSCSCPEQHSAAVEKLDLHYLCTNLSDQMGDRSKQEHYPSNQLDAEMHDNEPPLSLGKTYEEINLLVNAAFNKRLVSPSSSMDEEGDLSTMGNNSVSATGTSTRTLPGNGTLPKVMGVKVTRSLTEKRKDYVRRISIKGPEAIPAIVSNNYGSLNKTFKSPVRTFTTAETPARGVELPSAVAATSVEEIAVEAVESTGDRIKRFQKLIQESDKNGEQDAPKLFKCCLLVGFNLSTNLPYKKFVYPMPTATTTPTKNDVPQNIEHLIFPTRNLLNQKRPNQEYSLILTDNNGHQVYGYCRRVLPENCEYCLPLAYCIVSDKKAPGFYFRVLKEIEVRHGQTEGQAMVLLKHLHNCLLPEPGKFLHVKVNLNTVTRRLGMISGSHKVSPKRMSLEANPKWLTEASISTLEKRGAEEKKANGTQSGSISVDDKTLSFINRGMLLKNGTSPGESKMEEILIRRPTDLRLESTELSTLYDSLGSELLLHAFSSLLLERKVILFGENIAIVTSCVLGLQTILYPFKWQHTLVTILPENLLEICQAPFPVLAGTLTPIDYELEDGLVIDVDRRLLVQHCGDEFTILPSSLRSSLLMSLEMVNLIDQGKMLSNVLIAEAFLRFFVELFANYKQKVFDKEVFIESHPVASVNLFLEWFVETSLFRHFLNNKPQFRSAMNGRAGGEGALLDDQLEENYYALFDAKLLEKAENKSKTDQSIENIMKNCKIINKKAKTFKERFKHFFD